MPSPAIKHPHAKKCLCFVHFGDVMYVAEVATLVVLVLVLPTSFEDDVGVPSRLGNSHLHLVSTCMVV